MKRSLLVTCFFCFIIIFVACRDDMEDSHTVNKEEPIAYNEYVVADDLDAASCADMLSSNITSFGNQVDIANQYIQTDPQYAYKEYHKGTEYLLNVACIIHKYPKFNNIYWIDDIDGFYHAVQNADLSFKEFMDVVNSDINDSEFNSLKENSLISFDNISEYLNEISQSSKIMSNSLTENDMAKNTESNDETKKTHEDYTNNANNSYSGSYDATLKYSGTSGVLICISEDTMDRFMTAVNNDNQGTLNELFLNGEVAYTEQGTKCNIVKKKLTKCQVKLLDGTYKGSTVWVIIEALQEE